MSRSPRRAIRDQDLVGLPPLTSMQAALTEYSLPELEKIWEELDASITRASKTRADVAMAILVAKRRQAH